MIFVDRSTVPIPNSLNSPKVEKERARVASLLRSSKVHRAQLRVTFAPVFWLEANRALLALFHRKCAYCESRIPGPAHGGIEHHRPKQGARNLDAKSADHLHYAWLAYEWENLLLACSNCSRRQKFEDRMVGKRDLFPVKGPRTPLLATIAECRANEKALLLDPTFDDPAVHLSFDSNGVCTGRTHAGQVTIELLALNRELLVSARKRKWAEVESTVRQYADAIRTKQEVVPLRQRLRKLLSANEQYLAAARAAFQITVAALVTRGRLSYDNRARLLRETWDTEDLAFPLSAPRMASAVPLAAAAPSGLAPSFVSAPVRYEGCEALPPFAHQRIRRIEIHNFKAIESLDFDLRDPVTGDDEHPTGALMLLGENASGKSTVLEAVALALLGTRQIRKLGLRGDDYIRRTNWAAGSADAQPASVRVFFEGTAEPVSLTINPRSRMFSGNEEPATVLLAYGPRRFFSEGRQRRSKEPYARVKTLCDPMAVLTNPNSWLMSADEERLFDPTIRALRQILLLPDEAVVERPPKGKRKGAEMTFQIQGVSTPLKRLSEGYKTVVATGVDIMRELLRYWPDLESACGVVLIDEIETHLHPRWKMRIVQRLREALPQVQFIATTHDPLCLRGMYDGEVKVLVRDEQSHIERLADVPNVQGLSVEQLLTSDYFGLFSTEDPAFEQTMARYAALATKRDRTPEENDELESHRQTAHDVFVLGDTPQVQVVQEAVSQYLLDRRTTQPADRAALKRDSISNVVNLWKSLESTEVPE